ncbi:MAG: DUF6531 domain-containing protein, partial [Clostridiales bacterium]|nr:DUF6531 domain-containing protein [Clostridiales bacterium]
MIYFLKSKKWRKNITNKIKNRIQRAITIVVLLSFIFTSTGIPAQATGFGNTVLDDLIIEDNIPSSVLPKDWVDDPILDFSAWEEQSEQVLEAEEVVKLTPSLTIINNSVELEEEALTTLVDEEEEVSAAAGDEGEVVKLVTAPFLYQYDQNESVNLNTGALNVTMTDLTLPGKNGLDLVISRTYDSSDANFFDTYSDGTINSTKLNRRSLKDSNYNCYTGRLASGWRFNFSFMDTDYKRIHLADGRVYSYKKHGGSIYALIDSSRDNASGTQDGLYIYCNTNNDPYASYRSALWTLCYKDGKKEFFDKDGHLIGIQDRFGNTIDFEYSNGADWVTTTITDSVNRVLTISSAVIPSEGLNNDYEVIIRQDQDVLF